MSDPTAAAFQQYILKLRETPLADHTEMTGRGALETLLNSFKQAKTIVTHEPRRAQKRGAPDFKIEMSGQTIGYVENKAVGENLDSVLKSDQLKKYRQLSPNLIVTDYLRWVWERDGVVQADVRLGEAGLLEDRKANLRPERVSECAALLKGFLSHAPQGVTRAKALAEALAVRTQLLRDYLGDELIRQQDVGSGGQLFGLFEAFKKQVSHELTLAEFADAFAQTLAYGLFLAKLNDPQGSPITLTNAKTFIPQSVALIRELVGFLDNLDRPEYVDLRWVVEEVLSIVNGIDLTAISEDLSFRGRKGRRGTKAKDEEEWRLFSRDPFIYFYEDFLAKYDEKLRKSRGVYYTPPPIVNFIVRAVHDILKDTFGIEQGLADRKRVTVLDFACGTGTFLVEVLERIFEEVPPESGKAQALISDHVLKNIFGFEYLIAPYTVAHLKLAQYLKDKGFAVGADERFQVYLTNTVEPIEPEKNYLVPELSHETELAQAVKDQPILVITGNPPYARHSKNTGPHALASVRVYKEGIPELSKPAQGKPLQDDYVKFIRFAQSKMDNSPEGMVAVITNHSYLENPTLRGMRSSLLKSFDQIFIIDLHGSAEQPVTPDGFEDRNVFDIKTGVAISIFIKRKGVCRGVWHLSRWGSRQSKYDWGATSTVNNEKFDVLTPSAPLFLFAPRDAEISAIWESRWSVADIFSPVGDPAPGGVSTQDQFAISFERAEAIKKAKFLIACRNESEARNRFRLCSTNQWSFTAAQLELGEIDLDLQATLITFRPFDPRWTIWSRQVFVHRRERVNAHMLQPNIGLATARRNRGDGIDHFFVSEFPTEAKAAESSTQSFIFPLYLYASVDGGLRAKPIEDLFGQGHDPFAGKERIENIAPKFRRWLDARLGGEPAPPEAVLGYIYAVLHTPAYRTRYADFLRTSFPRVPFPEERAQFDRLAALGWALVEAHMLKEVPKHGLGAYSGQGRDTVENPRYEPEGRRLWINADKHFAKVPEPVWCFTIGGYQVLDKYLKSRKDRVLSLDEQEHVENVVNVLDFTIKQMAKIDTAYLAIFE